MSAKLEPRMFGTVERRLFRATAVVLAIVAFTALIAGVVWVVLQALSFFYNLIMPLCVAGILALVLNPVVDSLERHWRLSRLIATSIVMLLFIAIIIGTMVMVVPIMVRQVLQFIEAAPGVLSGWWEHLSYHFPDLTRIFMDSAEEGELNEIVPDMEDAGTAARSYAGMLVGLSFVPLMLFFAMLSGGRLRSQTIDVLSVFSARTQKKVMYFIDVFVTQLTGFFQGQLVIAVIMGTLLAIGFTLVGLEGGTIIGLALGLLNIVPFLGTLIGLLIVLPLAYFQPQGGIQLLGLSLLVFAVVQLVESWLLTPKIMANRSGLHPAMVVISVFFWGTALGGVTGMILAVPLTAFLIAVWSQVKEGLTQSMKSDEDAGQIAVPSGTTEPSLMQHPPDHPEYRRSTAKQPSSTRKQGS